MSGARLALTAARALRETKGRYALVTMCIGVGQGYAIILERTSNEQLATSYQQPATSN
jgi:acetyl-CoA acetyltransferase